MMGSSRLGITNWLGILESRFGDPCNRGSRNFKTADAERAYDLEDRLVALVGVTCRIVTELPPDRVAGHIAGQLTRCSTSPAANYAEARGAESRRDFVHKMKVCLKELRETMVWLKLLRTLEIRGPAAVEEAIAETDELIAIFVTGIATARRNTKRKGT
jgi:four helix bundle protein